ncbi:hypothetical protein ACFRQM_33065 [Streptomyces sp. NPDC056831]|uniref:hypothetical protein n=1 Tax=Streptomyces sp. NPDC056831 TaxID=3345954 RepID=UPI0036BA4BD1
MRHVRGTGRCIRPVATANPVAPGGDAASILGRIADDPRQRVSQLIAATDADVHLVLHDWNHTAGAVPDLLIHQLSERQAARTPDAVSARSGARRWRYDELESAANRVGHLLRDLDLGSRGSAPGPARARRAGAPR